MDGTDSTHGVPEAWRCDACGELIYNRDERGYPAPGAPMPHYWSVTKPKVCTVCFEMAVPIMSSDYWKALHVSWLQDEMRQKDSNDRLTGRRDYFTGA